MNLSETNHQIQVRVAQFPITFDVQHNLEVILSAIRQAAPETLVVFPEGALSGYADDLSFLPKVDLGLLHSSLQHLRQAAEQHNVHIIFGSCLFEHGCWYNAGLYYGPQGEPFIYHKINLATHERQVFTPGNTLPILEVTLAGRQTKIGIQLCREIRFPEQWQYLARAGAELFVYITNAIAGAAEAPVWRSHLVSRAAENQRFVVCANNAHTDQKCPSMIINPRGQVLWEVCSPELEMGQAELDLSQVSDWYLSQARTDVVAVKSGV